MTTEADLKQQLARLLHRREMAVTLEKMRDLDVLIAKKLKQLKRVARESEEI